MTEAIVSALNEDFLTILSHGDRRYGLEILRLINSARASCGITELGVGSLYPTLSRLERDGLISSEGEDNRRYYQISELGLQVLIRVQRYRLKLQEAGADRSEASEPRKLSGDDGQ